jgi:CRP/FNR family transcriptional regulator, anaerobic regulatory protein
MSSPSLMSQPLKQNAVAFMEIPSTTTVNHEAGWRCQGHLWSNLREVCDLLGICAPATSIGDETLFQHVRIKTGQRVHSIGQVFESLYIVHSGFLKTALNDEYGNEQVLNFPMKGDLLGIDGIHDQHHASEATALTDCDLIVLPYKKFSAMGRVYPELEQAILHVLSRELVQKQAMVGRLSALSAEAKVARFLTNLGERFSDLGYSGKCFNLRMTRQELGSYLGLTLETVSRTLSAFNELGYITVDQRQICLLDIDALNTLRRFPPTKGRCKAAEKVSSLVVANLIPQWKKDAAVLN